VLEAARQSGRVRRWILAGGDAAMGIYYYPQSGPITEKMPHRAYPGCYAFSKVVEEVMGQQYHVQYGLPFVCLRASWIQHQDMILRHLSAASWAGHLSARQKAMFRKSDYVALAMHPDGRPVVRHVVGLNDVVAAFLLAMENPASAGETFNIAAPAPFAYDEAAEYLSRKTSLPTMRIKVPEAHDFTIDIRKARKVLGYRPQYDIFRIIDDALAYRSKARGAT